MSFGEHLIELRARIILCLLTVIVAFVFFFVAFAHPLYEVLLRPAKSAARSVAAELAEAEGQDAGARVAKALAEAGGAELAAEQLAKAAGERVDLRLVAEVIARARQEAKPALPEPEAVGKRVTEALGRTARVAVDASQFLVSEGPTAMFVTTAYFCFLAAIALTIPVTGYHMWRFVAPGLKRRERHAILPVLTIGTGLFLLGALFAYFTVVPIALKFLMGYTVQFKGVKPLWMVRNTVKFESVLLLVFGLAFELPLVMVALTRIGVVTPEMVAKKRRYAILIIFIAGAILTPPDVVTQCLLAGPVIVLLEISIQVSKLFRPKRSRWETWDEEDHADHATGEGAGPSTPSDRPAAPSDAAAAPPETPQGPSEDEPVSQHGEGQGDDYDDEYGYGYEQEYYDDYEFQQDYDDWYEKTEEERRAIRRARRLKERLGGRRPTRGGQRRSRWSRRGGRRGRGR